MSKSTDHLPAGKRREIEYVVEILTEEFAKSLSTRQSKILKTGQILKVILFGSYARGDWVEDPVGRYFSDFDLLIVVNHERLTDVLEFWESAEKRLLAELSSGQRLRTPVNFIVHGLDDINEQLSLGRYFFVDIVRDGIALLDLPGHPFVEPQPLAPATALEEVQGYYDDWTGSAKGFLRSARHDIDDDDPKLAAFHLHQAAEHLYNGLLLVLTLYAPLCRVRHKGLYAERRTMPMCAQDSIVYQGVFYDLLDIVSLQNSVQEDAMTLREQPH